MIITFKCSTKDCPNNLSPVEIETDEKTIYCGGCFTEQAIK